MGGHPLPSNALMGLHLVSVSATGHIQMRVSHCPIAIEILTWRAGLSKRAAFPLWSWRSFEVLAQTHVGQFSLCRLNRQLFERKILPFNGENKRGTYFYPPQPPTSPLLHTLYTRLCVLSDIFLSFIFPMNDSCLSRFVSAFSGASTIRGL